MAVISVANPKGGSGKTTLVMVLAQELAQETSVAVIDTDPNGIIGAWARRRIRDGREAPFAVVERPTEKAMVSTAADLSREHGFVLIDLEGTASRMVSRALARSNMVLIPMNASPIDAAMAARAIDLVGEEEEALERRIPYRVVMSRTGAAVRTRSMRRILEEAGEADVPVIATCLNEMAAFRDIFEFGLTLDELDGGTTSNVMRAREVANRLAGDVVEALGEEYR